MNFFQKLASWIGEKTKAEPCAHTDQKSPSNDSAQIQQTRIPESLLPLQNEVNSILQASLEGMSIEEQKEHFYAAKSALLKLIEESEKYPEVNITGLDEISEQLNAFWESINPPKVKTPYTTKDTAKIVILDTETTGLDNQDELISVAAVVFEVELPSGKMLKEIECFYGLREPSVLINPEAQKIHGISMEQLRGKSLDITSLKRIVESVDVLIAHNAQFDRRMLMKLLPGIENEVWGCSMLALRDHWVELPNKSLETICQALEVSRAKPHNALSDCRALSEVLFKHSGQTKRSRTYMGHLVMRPWIPPI